MSTFAALVLLTLVTLVVADGQVYKAAVVKHDSSLINNIGSYLNLINDKIYEASIQDVDIVVIPELNIAQSIEFASEIPDSNDETPCTWSNEMPIKHISCAAKNSQIYVAVNLLEKSQSDTITYSSIIVLDREGQIISKISDVFNKNSKKKTENNMFKTDFNATFEHVSFKDLYDSSYDSSKFENTKNFIVWINKSDHAVSPICIDNKSWIYGRDLNLLTAETDHSMNLEKSRICNGKYNIENQYVSETTETQLVLAVLNKKWCSDNIKNTNKTECLRYGVENTNENKMDYDTNIIKNIWDYIFSKLQIISFVALIYVLEML